MTTRTQVKKKINKTKKKVKTTKKLKRKKN